MNRIEFPRDWKRWSKQNINGPPRPAYINNAAFLCKHEMVGIDVNSEINHPTLIDAVNEKDWKNLQKQFVHLSFYFALVLTLDF